MKTFVSPFFLRCAMGLILSAGFNLMAQAPAAPASGGGARTGGTTGGNAGRTTSGTTTSRTGTNATRTNTTAPAAATSGTNTTNTSNAAQTNATGTNATGTNANTPANRTTANPSINGTNPNGANTGTTATGTNANRTNATGTNATGVNTTGTTAGGTSATGVNANGTRTTGTGNQSGVTSTAGNASLPADTLTSSGMISSFGTNDFSLQGPTTSSPNATPSDFLIGPDTLFVDSLGNNVPRDRFFRRGGNVPATVYYTRSPNGGLVASKVMLTENQQTTVPAPIESAGTITEVSPGIMVIEQPGASDTPVRYVNNKTTNYVNENGEPVPPESVKAGTPVKIFYTKVGDTLVASRVEVHRNDKDGLPKPPVPAEESTRPAKK